MLQILFILFWHLKKKKKVFSCSIVIQLRLLARHTWLNEDQAVPHMNKLLAHVLCLMLLCGVCQRKRQQAILAKKNAERTVRKTHFRSHHCLKRVSEQLNQSNNKRLICLSVHKCDYPHIVFHMQQKTAARKPAPAKDDSFFGAFQGLSLDGLMGGSNGSAGAGSGDQCKVMWHQTFKDNETV